MGRGSRINVDEARQLAPNEAAFVLTLAGVDPNVREILQERAAGAQPRDWKTRSTAARAMIDAECEAMKKRGRIG